MVFEALALGVAAVAALKLLGVFESEEVKTLIRWLLNRLLDAIVLIVFQSD